MGSRGSTKYSKLFSVGQILGNWTVIGLVKIDRYAKVPCRCKCGKESMVDAYTLSAGKTKSCISCFNNTTKHGSNNNSWKGYQEIPASWFTRFRNYAKKKDNCFEINPEDIWKIFLKQGKVCALSGKSIDFVRRGSNGHAEYLASIDRIDSSIGYTLDNIQLVHKDVNIMKNAFRQEHFIEMCKAVAKHNETG